MPLTAAERQARHRAKQRLLRTAAGPGGVDRLSEMVMAKVQELVASGELQPTIKDGLVAERIIDQRKAKQDDRQLAFALGVLQAGGIGGFTAPAALIEDGLTIDGEAVEVD